MYKLGDSAVRSWTNMPNGQTRYPRSFDIYCPRCGTFANFQSSNASFDAHRGTVAITGTCAACRQPVDVWYVREEDLYVRPSPRGNREPIKGADLMPTAVRQAYQDTLDVYNAGVWSGTATLTRRTLEGLVHELLPEDERKNKILAQQIRQLAKSKAVDLAQPLITLSNSLKDGGNIGAHFDLTRTTDQATAEAMLDLIDYLIEYIYTLPEMIEEFDRKVQRLDRQNGEETDEQ